MTSTTTAAGEKVLCDTNVLLTALDRKRPFHRQALHVFDELPNRGVILCISGQIIRELIAVSSRSRNANGLGMTTAQTLDNANAFLARSLFLEETRQVTAELLRLIRTTELAGKQVHDANIVATMLTHGVHRVVTDNATHFRRFKDVVVLDLATVGVEGP